MTFRFFVIEIRSDIDHHAAVFTLRIGEVDTLYGMPAPILRGIRFVIISRLARPFPSAFFLGVLMRAAFCVFEFSADFTVAGGIKIMGCTFTFVAVKTAVNANSTAFLKTMCTDISASAAPVRIILPAVRLSRICKVLNQISFDDLMALRTFLPQHQRIGGLMRFCRNMIDRLIAAEARPAVVTSDDTGMRAGF